MRAPIDAYRKLDLIDRRIMLLSAVYYEAMTFADYKLLLMKLGWREGGKLIHQSFDHSVISRLLRAGLWTPEERAYRGLPALVEPLCQEAAEPQRGITGRSPVTS